MANSLEKLKVLVVDDNHHMTSIVKTILHAFEVRQLFEASTAEAAFQILRACPMDLIITDYAIRPIDGVTFTKMIRTAPESPNHYVPIIMLTAYAERSRVEVARDAGVTEFCAKPITAIELYRKIYSVITTPRSFIRTPVYFGPDRRRRTNDSYKGQERRESLFGPRSAPGASEPREMAP